MPTNNSQMFSLILQKEHKETLCMAVHVFFSKEVGSFKDLIILKNNLFCYVSHLFLSLSYQLYCFVKKASVSTCAL